MITKRLPLVLVTLAWPALADIPTIDDSVLSKRGKRDTDTLRIERVDRERQFGSGGVTCALYRAGRAGDAVGAARANPAISALVRRVAREEGIDESQFLALVYQESRFNPCARSGAGAIGLAQLMPATAAELGVDPHHIEGNLRGGARYFAQQLRRFDGNVALALAAYNAGPGSVDRFGGIPPFRETRAYVGAITEKWLPAFGGADAQSLPRGFGAAGGGFATMRKEAIGSMALTHAFGAGSADVAAWLGALANGTPGALQDSWDHNGTVRLANLAMLDRMIELAGAIAALINTRNGLRTSHVSAASRSGRFDRVPAGSADENCPQPNEVETACAHPHEKSPELLLTPQ